MMNRNLSSQFVRPAMRMAFVSLAAALTVQSAEPATPSAAQEVSDLIRKSIPGVSDSVLKKTTIEEILAELPGRVRWAGSVAPATVDGSNLSSAVTARLVDGRFLYVRVPYLDSKTVAGFRTASTAAVGTNAVDGVVLDLRFSHGQELEVVPAVASLAVAEKKSFLDFGEGMKESDGNVAFRKSHWVALVNGETTGAAESLAAGLRRAEAAILMGTTTAGRPWSMKPFTLKDGRILEIASHAVKTADGYELTAQGIAVDIESKLDRTLELQSMSQFLTNSPAEVSLRSSTNAVGTTNSAVARATRRRINEAELVRMQAEGRRLDGESVSAPAEPANFRVPAGSVDNTILRALDYLKALSLLKGTGRD